MLLSVASQRGAANPCSLACCAELCHCILLYASTAGGSSAWAGLTASAIRKPSLPSSIGTCIKHAPRCWWLLRLLLLLWLKWRRIVPAMHDVLRSPSDLLSGIAHPVGLRLILLAPHLSLTRMDFLGLPSTARDLCPLPGANP